MIEKRAHTLPPALRDGLLIAFCIVALVAFLIGFLLGRVAG